MRSDRGLYIHIPFCVKKCNYCAFLSFSANDKIRKAYTDALINEIRISAEILQANSAENENTKRASGGRPEIDTLYIGGGTPSVLSISQIEDIMRSVRSSFFLKPDAEITIEMNPGTLGDPDKEAGRMLEACREAGFNRLSMGVQSMDDERLKFLGRIHTAETVVRDLKAARKAGFDNINLDLIFSVPGESEDEAVNDVEKILGLGPEHISCYSLQLEEGTPFYKMANSGVITETSDEDDRNTYHSICSLLRAGGYEHYEISNFARCSPGHMAAGFGDEILSRNTSSPSSRFRSRHNSLYWSMSDYIGCGLGASGFTDGIRYRNITDIDEYIKIYVDIKEPSETNDLPAVLEQYCNSPFDNISEAVFTGLRRREGVSYEEAVSAYLRAGKSTDMAEAACEHTEEFFWEVFKEAEKEAADYVKSGHLIIDDKGLRLTEKGIDISNSIMALFV